MAADPIFKNEELQTMFDRQGFLTVPLIDTDGIKALNALFDKLNDKHPRDDKLGYMISAYSADDAYKKEVDSTASGIVQPFLDNFFDRYTLYGSTFAFKLPSKTSRVTPHQEWTMVDEEEHLAITCWIPLIDITFKNGPIYALPGSHYRNYKTIRGPQMGFYYDGFYKEVMKYSVPVCVKAGQAIILNQSLIHFSTPNYSSSTRKALITSIKSAGAHDTFLYYQAAERLEKYKVEADFALRYEDFLNDVAQPPPGEFLGEVDYHLPKLSKKELRQLFTEMVMKSGVCANEKELEVLKRNNQKRQLKQLFGIT